MPKRLHKRVYRTVIVQFCLWKTASPSTLSQAKFGSALVFTSEPNRFPRNLEFRLNFPRLPSRSLRETMDNTKVRAEVTLSVGHPFARDPPRFM